MTYRERNSGIKSTKDQVTLLAVALTILTTFVVFIMDLVLILSVQAKASLATAGIAQVWAGAAVSSNLRHPDHPKLTTALLLVWASNVCICCSHD